MLNESSNGFLESLSWKAIFAAIITVLSLVFAFPEYILNVRPQLENIIGIGTLSFIEGAISGTITTILVLKFLSERRKKPRSQKDKKK
jgi:hypothetical protein